MSIQKQFEDDVIDEVLQWSGEKIYCVFGARLENVVADKKAQLRYQLRVIWKNRLCYVFRDTGTHFDDDTMLLFFSYRQITKYNLIEMENTR